MNIQNVAKESGLTAKTIRYYEEVGLLPAPPRQENGYRAYSEDDIELLRFVRRARELGFCLAECHKLIALYRNPNRASRDVSAIALEKIAEIDRKIKEFEVMRQDLNRLVNACRRDDEPDCAILDELSQKTPMVLVEDIA